MDRERGIFLGSPRRAGNGTERAERFLRILRQPRIIGVMKMPGAIVLTRMPNCANSRAIGRVIATTPPFEAE